MTDPRWKQILDGGRLEGLSDAAREELLQIAEHDAECARRLEVEGWIDAAFAGDDPVRPSRALQQALLDVPRRDRRLRLLTPLMLPLALCICSFGSVHLYRLAPGFGSGLTAAGQRATQTHEALGMAPAAGAMGASAAKPEGASASPGSVRRTATVGSAAVESGPAATRAATLTLRLSIDGSPTAPPVSAPARATRLALLPAATPTRRPVRGGGGGGGGRAPEPSAPPPIQPIGTAPPPVPSATPDGSAGSGPGPASPTPTSDSNRVVEPSATPSPIPPAEPGLPSPTETPLPTPELVPSVTPTDSGRDDPVTPLPTGASPTSSPSATATSTITPTMTLTPTPGLRLGMVLEMGKGKGRAGAGEVEDRSIEGIVVSWTSREVRLVGRTVSAAAVENVLLGLPSPPRQGGCPPPRTKERTHGLGRSAVGKG